jgi:aminoglycoside phosphotransferase (APT) family kinase protein
MERLHGWLEHEGLAPVGELRVDQLSGGSSNLTFRVWDDVHDWVLRRPPEQGVLPTAHDVVREYRIQRALLPTPVPVPVTVAACEDAAVLGAPFYLMDRVDGVVHGSVDDVAALSPADARAVAFGVADALATIHAVDPMAVGLDELARPEPFVDRQLRRWRGQWERSKREPMPVLEDVLSRLEADRPPPQPVRIVHGDYNLANLMYARVEPTRVAAVLDWELTALGDALADVGALAAYWTEAGRLLSSRSGGHLPDANPGMPTRDELVARYESATGTPVEHLAFYEAMATVKLAVISAGALQRFADRSPEQAEHVFGIVRQLAEVATSVLDGVTE